MNTPLKQKSVAVIGSGVAGLYAAALAADAGHRVLLLTKGQLPQSNTWLAQGGISAVTAQGEAAGDSVAGHVADTLRAGAGLCDPAAVEQLCAQAAGEMLQLQAWGMDFDHSGAGLSLGLEGAHSAARILHAGGDATGAHLAGTLIGQLRRRGAAGNLQMMTGTFVTELLMHDGAVTGVRYLTEAGETGSPATGMSGAVAVDAVILATGGAGQLYEASTNPATATADGLALAWRAGAVLGDLEFIQFHPTLLEGTGFMVSEAVRGEGAVLRDDAGVRFMVGRHPDAELAPRDVVARAIEERRQQTGAPVYLDATHLAAQHGADFLPVRFPTIYRTLLGHGYDLNRVPVPVVPAQHYLMGGVRTDLDGRTSVPGLFAAGEVACTGVHGANRLASNSLLEGLVFARRAVAALAAPGDAPRFAAEDLALEPPGAQPFSRAELQRLMSARAGVVRDQASLDVAAKELRQWCVFGAAARYELETGNLLTVARLAVEAARRRTNSAGSHYRTDYPQPPAEATAITFRNAGAAL